jgi:hypothetical protein
MKAHHHLVIKGHSKVVTWTSLVFFVSTNSNSVSENQLLFFFNSENQYLVGLVASICFPSRKIHSKNHRAGGRVTVVFFFNLGSGI